MGSKGLPIFDNCTVLTIGDNKPIMFYVPTAENAKTLAMMLKRCLRAQNFSIDVRYKTPDGFVSAQQGGAQKFNISDSVFTPLQRTKEVKATHKLVVKLIRTEEFGGNIEFTLYFYSRIDMNSTADIIDLGLQRIYKEITCYVNPHRNGQWQLMPRQMYTDERFAKAIRQVKPEKLKMALYVMENFNSLSPDIEKILE